MAIGDDFTIDYTYKRIRHSITATTVWTVNALYSYLQDTFDEIDQMDDPIPMSAQTPTEYTLINGWFMSEARENEGGANYRNCFEYLKTGAIQTSGNNAVVYVLAFGETYTSAIASDIGLLVQNTGVTNTGRLLDYDNTAKKWWVRKVLGTFTTEAVTITPGGTGAGTITSVTTGEQLWANIYTLGTIEQHTNEEQIYVEQLSARYVTGAEWWPENKANATTRHVDILIKVKESSSEMDSGNITVYLRNYPTTGNADLYDHFGIDLSAGGRNAVPLATSPDLNNTDTQATASGYSGVTIAFVNGTVAYSSISGSFTAFETVTWAGGSGVFLRQTTGTGAGTMTLGNVTADYPLTSETITGASKTATASANMVEAYRMVKQFDQQATSPEYSVIIYCNNYTLASVYQYLKYVTRIGSTFLMYPSTYPQGGPLSHSTTKEGQLYIRAHEDTQTAPTNTFSPVKASPFGTFAGGKFFGAQGVWIQNMAAADVKNYQLIDADNTTQNPPNQQTLTISNLISGDRVSVFRTVSATDSSIKKDMYVSAAGNTASNAAFIVSTTITADTPAGTTTPGYIRVVDISDTTATREARYTYSSWSGSTFTLTGTLDRTYSTDDTAYVPFIDINATESSAAVTVIYTADRSIIIRVRRKAATAILPFETTGTFGSAGYSTTAIRTTDSIVT